MPSLGWERVAEGLLLVTESPGENPRLVFATSRSRVGGWGDSTRQTAAWCLTLGTRQGVLANICLLPAAVGAGGCGGSTSWLTYGWYKTTILLFIESTNK